MNMPQGETGSSTRQALVLAASPLRRWGWQAVLLLPGSGRSSPAGAVLSGRHYRRVRRACQRHFFHRRGPPSRPIIESSPLRRRTVDLPSWRRSHACRRGKDLHARGPPVDARQEEIRAGRRAPRGAEHESICRVGSEDSFISSSTTFLRDQSSSAGLGPPTTVTCVTQIPPIRCASRTSRSSAIERMPEGLTSDGYMLTSRPTSPSRSSRRTTCGYEVVARFSSTWMLASPSFGSSIPRLARFRFIVATARSACFARRMSCRAKTYSRLSVSLSSIFPEEDRRTNRQRDETEPRSNKDGGDVRNRRLHRRSSGRADLGGGVAPAGVSRLR